MLRDIAGIRLCGANFDEVTNILLLDPHEGNKVKPVKGTLLYGRNGAGKYWKHFLHFNTKKVLRRFLQIEVY